MTKKIKIRLSIIIVSFIFYPVACGGDYNTAAVLEDLMSDDSFEVINSHEIRFCPDNTCEIFRSGQNTTKQQLFDFIFLYLFHLSEYIYLSDESFGKTPFKVSGKKFEPKIQSRYKHLCVSDHKDAICVVEAMKKTFGIKVTFGRYDEGQFNES